MFGVVALVTYLVLTGGGYFAQVLKLQQRWRLCQSGLLPRTDLCAGLAPFRELVSFLGFAFFALSGLTRDSIDFILLLSRLPVLLLSTVILFFLVREVATRGRLVILGIGLIFDGLILGACGLAAVGRGTEILPQFAVLVDPVLMVIGVVLGVAKTSQSVNMYQSKRTAAVSWYRELGVLGKDFTGILYSLSRGFELRWVSMTHAISIVATIGICWVKYRVERGEGKPYQGS